jgi:predicted AAA+ superfamily ATPase
MNNTRYKTHYDVYCTNFTPLTELPRWKHSCNLLLAVLKRADTIIVEAFFGRGITTMSAETGDALVRALHDHNPWWEAGLEAFSLPRRAKSDFYHLARPTEAGSQFEDQPLLGLVGRRGVGKTTLLRQFVHHRIEAGDDPGRFLYLPFDADPLYQLHSDDQLRRAVRYYESRVLDRLEADHPHFLLLDDVHRVEHATKPTVDGWGVPVADLLRDTPGRHVVVTASAGVQVDRELEETTMDESSYDVQPILPEKFRDYVFTLYPALEDEDTRVSPTSLRDGDASLPAALRSGEIDPFVREVRKKYQLVADAERQIRSQVSEYLAMGGTISYAHDGAVESVSALSSTDFARLREEVRDALYQEVPGFESIQTIADLERLCALAARNRGAEPFSYQDLVDLFDVDRRTLADSYLPALSALYLLTGATEYDNRRPRSVRLYLRDTGLITALAGGDPATVRNDFEWEADLARVAAFDHTMRLAYGINALQGHDVTPDVRYWQGRDGEVDYVFEIEGTPVPIGLAYRTGDRDPTLDALTAFRRSYDTPLGLLVTGDTVGGHRPVLTREGQILELPYWLYLMLC